MEIDPLVITTFIERKKTCPQLLGVKIYISLWEYNNGDSLNNFN